MDNNLINRETTKNEFVISFNNFEMNSYNSSYESDNSDSDYSDSNSELETEILISIDDESILNLKICKAITTKSKFPDRLNLVIHKHYKPDIYLRIAKIYEEMGNEYDAIKIYEEAIKQNKSTKAMVEIGKIMLSKKIYKDAKIYFSMAMSYGNTDGTVYLAYIYETVDKDYIKAKNFYLQSIDRGNQLGMLYYTLFLENCLEKYQLNKYQLDEFECKITRMESLKKSVSLGNADAMVLLGNEYATKFEDYKTMKYYYRLAIEHSKSLDAIINLVYYYENKNINNNLEKKYLLLGTENGSIYCLEKYFIKYNEDFLLKIENIKKKWLKEILQGCHKVYYYCIAKLHELLKSPEKKIIYYYEKAIDSGNIDAYKSFMTWINVNQQF